MTFVKYYVLTSPVNLIVLFVCLFFALYAIKPWHCVLKIWKDNDFTKKAKKFQKKQRLN